MNRFVRFLLFTSLLMPLGCDAPKEPTSTGVASPTPAVVESVNSTPLPNINELVQRLVTQGGAKDASAEMRMQLEEADGKRAQLDFTLQRKYGAAKTTTLIKVNAPKEESDKALLATETPGAPTEAKSYLAGLKKIAALNSGSQVSFREAKVAVQELLGMELAQYDFAVAERAMLDGLAVAKAEGKAKANLNLAYPRIVAIFNLANQEPVGFEFFNEKNDLTKRVKVEEVKVIQNRQTVTRLAIEELLTKRKVKLETRSIKYDTNLADKLFTEENLKSIVTAASQKLINE